MSPASLGPLPRVLDLDDPRVVEEALARWDELSSETLAALRAHPEHGPRLERLWSAERWLDERAPAAVGPLAADAHPAAEELYDYGRGPGAVPLAPERLRVVGAHVESCAACAELVATLATSPPLPLVDEPPAEDETARAADGSTLTPAELAAPVVLRPRRRPRLVAWVPLAAAAALVAVVSLAGRLGSGGDGLAGADRSAFPAEPVLRGESSHPLLHPRGRVLGGPDTATAWSAAPRFEIAPVAGAERYRVVLFRHAGGAFSEGSVELDASAAEPLLDGRAAAPLAPGAYTWEAWARVDGLDRPLGSRDFQVVAEPDLAAALAALDGPPGEPLPAGAVADGLALVRRLHAAGLVTDARHLARRLPPSPERDAFLSRKPGR